MAFALSFSDWASTFWGKPTTKKRTRTEAKGTNCRFTRIKQKDGEVTSIEGEDFCSFRSINYAASERSEIEENPLEVFNTNQEIADELFLSINTKKVTP